MTLRDEILSRPECAAALALRDCGALAEILSVGRTKTVNVPIADLQAYLQGNGQWWTIKACAEDPAHPARSAAQGVVDVVNARYNSIDMTLPIVDQMLGALVAAGVIPQATMDGLKALAVIPDEITASQVQQALEGM